MKQKQSKAEIIGRLFGWGIGLMVGAVVHTYLGLTILKYLGWLPI